MDRQQSERAPHSLFSRSFASLCPSHPRFFSFFFLFPPLLMRCVRTVGSIVGVCMCPFRACRVFFCACGVALVRPTTFTDCTGLCRPVDRHTSINNRRYLSIDRRKIATTMYWLPPPAIDRLSYNRRDRSNVNSWSISSSPIPRFAVVSNGGCRSWLRNLQLRRVDSGMSAANPPVDRSRYSSDRAFLSLK